MFIEESTQYSHMPFVFRTNGQLQVVFSQCNARFRLRGGSFVAARPTAWKLQWTMPQAGVVQPLVTGLAENEEECSPTVFESDGQVQLSFIGRVASEKPSGLTLHGVVHRLFVMRGRNIHSLERAVPFSNEQCSCGFARPGLAVVANGVGGFARVVGGRFNSLKTSFEQLHRISFCSDRPDRLLITGSLGPRRGPQTIVFDIDAAKTGSVLGELRTEDRPSYKPSVVGDLTVLPLAQATGRGWRLWSTERSSIVPTTVEAKLE